MRTFGSGFESKLASTTYRPVVFCSYELVTYVSGATPNTGTKTTTTYRWSEREVTYGGNTYARRIVKVAPLEQVLDESRQGFGEMGLQISNADGDLSSTIQSGMKCTVYLGFEDSNGAGTVTDAEVIFVGTVSGDIEVTEDSVSFSMIDIAHTYDTQIPALIDRNEFEQADPDAIGDTKPIIMGRVKDHECRPVAAGLATTVGIGWSIVDPRQSPFKNKLYVSDDIGWWYDLILGPSPTVNNRIEIEGFAENFAAYVKPGQMERYVTIEDIGYDSSVGLWYIEVKAVLNSSFPAGGTIQADFVAEPGDTVISLDEAATDNGGYAYLVADHPVEKITNVKVNGIARPGAIAIPNYDGTQLSNTSWNLPYGKAYVIIPSSVPIKVSRSGLSSISVVDSIAVVDTIGVDDTIQVDEPGHKHVTSATKYYNHIVDFSYSFALIGGDEAVLRIKSGTTFQKTLFLYGFGAVQVQVPNGRVAFTSDGEDVQVYAYSASKLIGLYNLNLRGQRIDPTTGQSTFAFIYEPVVPRGLYKDLDYPTVGVVTVSQEARANVSKSGTASKTGSASKTGTVTLQGGNSAADVLIGGGVTCDVVGQIDNTTGRRRPHEMIKALVNKTALNPISGSYGSADIVEFEDETELNTYFDTIYNTDGNDTVSGVYDALNDPARAGDTQSKAPNQALGNARNITGLHQLDFAITEPNRLRDIVGDMLYQSNLVLNWRNGVAQIKLHKDNPDADGTISDGDIVMKSMSLSRKQLSDLGTDISVRYDYSQQSDYNGRYNYALFTGSGATLTKTPLDATRVYGTYSKERFEDLTMIRDKVAAEIIAKRIYDQSSGAKYLSGFTTVLKNLKYEPGDFVDVSLPVHKNAILDAGIVRQKTLAFGSALDRQPDVITYSVEENYSGTGVTLSPAPLSDSISIVDGTPATLLNDVNSKFQTLSDSFSITDSIQTVPSLILSDTVNITEVIGRGMEMRLDDFVFAYDFAPLFNGLLFWSLTPFDLLPITDSISASAADSVYEVGVYVGTDLTTIGVFQ